MDAPLPIIFKKKSLFKRPSYGLKTPDGSRILLPAEYAEIRPCGARYFAALNAHWYCFDELGRQLPIYLEPDRPGASPLVYCAGFQYAPEFIDGFAIVKTVGSRNGSWYVVDTCGRVVLSAGSCKPVRLSASLFGVVEEGALTLFDAEGSAVMRMPDPSPVAALDAGSKPGPLQLQSGFWQFGEFRFSDNAAGQLDAYLARFGSDCGLCLLRTEDCSDSLTRFTCVFAPGHDAEPCLYLRADLERGVFSLCVPEASYSGPHDICISDRLSLPPERISHLEYLQICHAGYAFLPADARDEDYITKRDDPPPYDPSDDYPPGYTQL